MASTPPLAPAPESNQQTPHCGRHPARQRQEDPEEGKQDRYNGQDNNHDRRVNRNQRKDLHVTSPVRPTLPCKFEKRNGTLDIAALVGGRNALACSRTGAPWEEAGGIWPPDRLRRH